MIHALFCRKKSLVGKCTAVGVFPDAAPLAENGLQVLKIMMERIKATWNVRTVNFLNISNLIRWTRITTLETWRQHCFSSSQRWQIRHPFFTSTINKSADFTSNVWISVLNPSLIYGALRLACMISSGSVER